MGVPIPPSCPHCGAPTTADPKCYRCGFLTTFSARPEPYRSGQRVVALAIAIATVALVGLAILVATGIPLGPSPSPKLSWADAERQARTVSWDSLARNPGSYRGDLLKMSGKVIQVIRDGSGYQLRVDVELDKYGYSNKTVFLLYPEPSSRLLEDDLVDFVGYGAGEVTYKTVLGAEITLPALNVLYLSRH